MLMEIYIPGFIMIFSSMIPSSIIDADWSKLFGVGVSFIFIGRIVTIGKRKNKYSFFPI